MDNNNTVKDQRHGDASVRPWLKNPRVTWRQEPWAGEERSEYQRITEAAVPLVRTGRSILQAVIEAQKVLPKERQRGKLGATSAVPPKLVKMIERAVEDSLERNIPLPKVVPPETAKAMTGLEARVTELQGEIAAHRCPQPPTAEEVLNRVLTSFLAGVIKQVLLDPAVQEVVDGLIPKRRAQTLFDRVVDGTRPEIPALEVEPPVPAPERKPIVLIAGIQPPERDRLTAQLGHKLTLRFWDGRQEGHLQLKSRALTSDLVLVNTNSTKHDVPQTLKSIGVYYRRFYGGQSALLVELRSWAKEKGIDLEVLRDE